MAGCRGGKAFTLKPKVPINQFLFRQSESGVEPLFPAKAVAAIHLAQPRKAPRKRIQANAYSQDASVTG